MGLSGEHGQSRVREEVLAARRMGNQGLPQGTPPGALVPQEHPQPSPRMRTQVRGWEDPAEPWGWEWLQDAHLWVSQGGWILIWLLGAKKNVLEMPEVQEKQQPHAKLSPGASNKSRDWSYL